MGLSTYDRELNESAASLILTDHEVEVAFVNYLNECYGDVEICGMTYPAAEVLKDADPVAFYCIKFEFISEEFEEVYDDNGSVVGFIRCSDADDNELEED